MKTSKGTVPSEHVKNKWFDDNFLQGHTLGFIFFLFFYTQKHSRHYLDKIQLNLRLAASQEVFLCVKRKGKILWSVSGIRRYSARSRRKSPTRFLQVFYAIC